MKKLFITLAILFSSVFSVFALPGFSPYINDISGEYVYFQDKTFKRESYVGFLMYDEKTYAARYFAPAKPKENLPEKEIKIFFTLNPDSDHIELTGEKIATNIMPDDTEIVNYIHDLIYELPSRRAKAGEIAPSENASIGVDFLHTGIRINENFPQFGGNVTVIYDFLVPLFNVKLIESSSAESVFFVVTCGRLSSSNDNSFDSFKGFPEKFSDKNHSFKKNRKAEEKIYSTSEGQSIVLDSNWVQSMENLWLLGDASLISMGTIPETTVVNSEKTNFVSPFILRQLLLSSSASYVDWKTIFIENYDYYIRNKQDSSQTFTIRSLIYQPETQNLTRNIKIITKKENLYHFFTLTAFDNVYRKNEKYFEKIIKSYKN